jgi:uncharacterized membrane protein
VNPGLPAYTLLADSAAVLWLVAAALGGLYALFAALWVARVVAHPDILVNWLACAEQTALVAGAAVVFVAAGGLPLRTVDPALRALRRLLGLCALAFGIAHFYYAKETAAMVPAWLPPGQRFWALATGAGHLLGGVALLSGVLVPIAARSLALMFLSFELFVWVPRLLVAGSQHVDWAGNGITLALVGAVWVLADSLRTGTDRPAG